MEKMDTSSGDDSATEVKCKRSGQKMKLQLESSDEDNLERDKRSPHKSKKKVSGNLERKRTDKIAKMASDGSSSSDDEPITNKKHAANMNKNRSSAVKSDEIESVLNDISSGSEGADSDFEEQSLKVQRKSKLKPKSKRKVKRKEYSSDDSDSDEPVVTTKAKIKGVKKNKSDDGDSDEPVVTTKAKIKGVKKNKSDDGDSDEPVVTTKAKIKGMKKDISDDSDSDEPVVKTKTNNKGVKENKNDDSDSDEPVVTTKAKIKGVKKDISDDSDSDEPNAKGKIMGVKKDVIVSKKLNTSAGRKSDSSVYKIHVSQKKSKPKSSYRTWNVKDYANSSSGSEIDRKIKKEESDFSDSDKESLDKSKKCSDSKQAVVKKEDEDPTSDVDDKRASKNRNIQRTIKKETSYSSDSDKEAVKDSKRSKQAVRKKIASDSCVESKGKRLKHLPDTGANQKIKFEPDSEDSDNVTLISVKQKSQKVAKNSTGKKSGVDNSDSDSADSDNCTLSSVKRNSQKSSKVNSTKKKAAYSDSSDSDNCPLSSVKQPPKHTGKTSSVDNSDNSDSDFKPLSKKKNASVLKSEKKKSESDISSRNASSDEEDKPRKKNTSDKTKPIKKEHESNASNSDIDSDSNSYSPKEKEDKKNTNKKELSSSKKQIKAEVNSSSDSPDDDKPLARMDNKAKKSDSSSDDSSDEALSKTAEKSRKRKKSNDKLEEERKVKRQRKSSSSKRKGASNSDSSDDDSKNKTERRSRGGEQSKGAKKIERLKQYLSTAGIRVKNYAELWKDCKSDRKKADCLLKLLEESGIKGRPTLEKCKKLKKKRETEADVAELDLGNIVTGRRTRRQTDWRYSEDTNSAKVAIKEGKLAEIKKMYSRIKDIVSSESGSD